MTHQLSIPVGRFVTVKCNPGFRLDGDERVECDPDGNLRNQTTCEGKIRDLLRRVDNLMLLRNKMDILFASEK